MSKDFEWTSELWQELYEYIHRVQEQQVGELSMTSIYSHMEQFKKLKEQKIEEPIKVIDKLITPEFVFGHSIPEKIQYSFTTNKPIPNHYYPMIRGMVEQMVDYLNPTTALNPSPSKEEEIPLWAKIPAKDYLYYLDLLRQKKEKEDTKEPDWEIISFVYGKAMDNEIRLRADGNYYYAGGTKSGTAVVHLMEGTDWHIKSVKRKSDSVVFTIGDTIEHREDGYKCKILKFVIPETESLKHLMWFKWEERKDYVKDLKNFIKPKQESKVLFTTEDGVGIKEGDRLWYVLMDNFQIHNNPANKYDGGNNNYRYFSTKEKAEEYILQNKPCLSMKDVIDICDTNFLVPFCKIHTGRLREITKLKIK